jgi:hypothetical protein
MKPPAEIPMNFIFGGAQFPLDFIRAARLPIHRSSLPAGFHQSNQEFGG